MSHSQAASHIEVSLSLHPMPFEIAAKQCFTSLDKLKHACHEYAFANYFETHIRHCNARQYELLCKVEGCPWSLYASSVASSSTFVIKTIKNEHTCFGINHAGNSAATSDFVARFIHEKLAQQSDYRPIEIVKDIKREYDVEITYIKAYHAKEAALVKINGIHEETYANLPKYC